MQLKLDIKPVHSSEVLDTLLSDNITVNVDSTADVTSPGT